MTISGANWGWEKGKMLHLFKKEAASEGAKSLNVAAASFCLLCSSLHNGDAILFEVNCVKESVKGICINV